VIYILPTFLICGTQKGGTTALYYYLREHPEIYMTPKKEVHFFDLNYHLGIKWYKKHFKGVNNGKIKAIGEATPFYMYLESVPMRIFNTLPDVKLIFILRDPVKRAYSHYWHEVRLGYESLSFNKAIEKEEDRLSKGDLFSKQHYSYKDRGKYIIQLERFRKYFPKNQLLILINEELKENPHEVLQKVFEFLGVNPRFFSNKWRVPRYQGRSPRCIQLQKLRRMMPIRPLKMLIDFVNLKEGYPPMNSHIKKFLIEYFEPYNIRLEAFLGRKIEKWLRRGRIPIDTCKN